MSLYAQYAALLDGVLDDLVAEGVLPAELDRKNVTVEPPRDPAHGDLATNAAMVLAKGAGTNPRALAEAIKPKLEAVPVSDLGRDRRARLHQPAPDPDAWRDELKTILREGDDMASRLSARRAGQCRICLGQPDRADPHGPLPRRGGRRRACAAARGRGLPGHQGILRKRRRRQVDTLARSVHLRYRETLGEHIGGIPEGIYPGDYLEPVGVFPPPNLATNMSARRRPIGSPCSSAQDGRGNARPHPS